jgi:hypothetical protein
MSSFIAGEILPMIGGYTDRCARPRLYPAPGFR